jgi:ribosomal protein S18 acetylase RimI-like enzyme
MKIRQIDVSEAALLGPLNAVVQSLHVAARPDVFHADATAAEVTAYFAGTLAQPGWFALIAEDDAGQAVGYGLCEVQDVARNAMNVARKRGFLHHIAVIGPARRQGVASALIDAAKARFQAAGATVWATTYWQFNAASAGLMAKAGLRPAIVLADAPL